MSFSQTILHNFFNAKWSSRSMLISCQLVKFWGQDASLKKLLLTWIHLNFFRSNHECEVEVTTGGRLESSICQESHLFQPFSSKHSGATSKIIQTVHFVGESAGQPVDHLRLPTAQKSSLLFKHDIDEEEATNDDAERVLELLESLELMDDSLKPEEFSRLVHSMRKLSHPQLVNIFYNGIKDSNRRSLALDALPLLKTDAGIILMKDIIASGKLPIETLDQWMATLPFYRNPTRGMLGIVLVRPFPRAKTI